MKLTIMSATQAREMLGYDVDEFFVFRAHMNKLSRRRPRLRSGKNIFFKEDLERFLQGKGSVRREYFTAEEVRKKLGLPAREFQKCIRYKERFLVDEKRAAKGLAAFFLINYIPRKLDVPKPVNTGFDRIAERNAARAALRAKM